MRKVLGAVCLLLLLTGCGGATASAPASTTPSQTKIWTARHACDLDGSAYAPLGDSTHTITMQGAPQYSSAGLTWDQQQCVLGKVGAPDSVTGEMLQTRALDGMQKGSWDGFSASWTYHPDHGLEIILTESR